MPSKMGYYNVEEFTKQKRQQEREIKVPPKANFLAAANHIRSLFEGKKLHYGVMGGLEMLCLGYRREMPDLQIAYDDRDFHRIRAKLATDQRVRLPEGMNSLFPAKILVRTGPAYKDEGCTQAADIEVDLVPPGSNGTPPSGSLNSNLVLLSLKNEGKLKSFRGLNILHLVKSLTHYCRVRDLAWDPRKDILFLCQHYGEEVHSIRHQLDQKAVQQNFLGMPFFSRLPPEDQRRCYQVLLGTEPPPIMAITPPVAPPAAPPGHKHSVSASEVMVTPRISPHKSSPSLSVQQSPGLLSPPLPGNSKASRKHDSGGDHRPSELVDSSHARSSMPMELPVGPRDSRSRYRPISAPHSPPDDADTTITPMKSSKLQPPHAVASAIVSPSNNVQHASNHQLYPPSHLNLGNMAKQNRKSMPNLNAGSSGPVPAYAFAQTPSLSGFVNAPRQVQPYVSPAEMSATPAPMNPGQQYMKAQLGLGGSGLSGKHTVNNIPITERPVPPQARLSQQGPQLPRAELTGLSRPEGHADRLHPVNPDISNNGKRQPASAIELPSSEVHSVESGTRLSPRNDVNRRHIPSVPVELDAEDQIGQYIAELSGERSTPAPKQHYGEGGYQNSQAQQHIPIQPQSMLSNVPAVRDSPVSPPDSYADLVPSHAQHEDAPIRPLNPRTQSTPLAALPMSLMVGGPAHYRSANSDMTHPPALASGQAIAPATNASRYTRYYAAQTPPSSAPNSARASPQAAPNSTYKAYQPPSMSLSPPSLPLPPPDDDQQVASEATERTSRPTSFSKLRDVDGAQEYFRAHPGHKRGASHDSQASNASHDSSKLAQEYQAELPGYGAGYGSPAKS